MEPVITMKDISKSFGEKRVLKEISFAVEKGEIFGLLGPSGAGKTTIIKILTGQLAPTGGSAGLLGKTSTRLGSAEYARIGMVLDENGLYKRLSVWDNMALFADIYGVDKTGIMPALEKVGLREAAKKPAEKLSKGMLQRLAFARALLHKPDVLFLDEPTSGLDPATAQSIHKLIAEQQARGCTVFLTTHNMEEAASLCGTVVLLNDGRIVEEGAPASLCLKYNTRKMLHIRRKNGQLLEMENNSAAAGQIARLFAQEDVEAIHSSEPNLETVFITLTGRKLA